jgi:nitrite reductase (cytochrome c-552)
MTSKTRLALALLLIVVITILVLALLVSIFERRQEAKLAYFKVAEINEDEPDPQLWGLNFPRHYDNEHIRVFELQFVWSIWGVRVFLEVR